MRFSDVDRNAHPGGYGLIGHIPTIDIAPHQIAIAPMVPVKRLPLKTWHKKPGCGYRDRINKKWEKRYGFKNPFGPGEVLILYNTIYCNREDYVHIKQKMKSVTMV